LREHIVRARHAGKWVCLVGENVKNVKRDILVVDILRNGRIIRWRY
jgi:hypothetical protein